MAQNPGRSIRARTAIGAQQAHANFNRVEWSSANFAQCHGGPFPATSNAAFTSVGASAIDRFLRPVCYQDIPDSLLPEALQAANPLGLWRLIDGERVHA